MIIMNAFSANMLAEFPCSVTFAELTLEQARLNLLLASEEKGEMESAVGHADTAGLFSNLLGITVPCRRATVTLRKGDEAVLGQYIGPRLPEGCTTLPEGAIIKWLHVKVE